MRNIFLFILLGVLCCTSSVYPQNYPYRRYTVADGLPQSQSLHFFQDSRGFIWIMTHNGISRFDGVEFKNYFRKDGLPANFIISVLELSDGGIYAVAEEGISFYDGQKFIFYPPPDSIIISNVSSPVEIDNNIVFITTFRKSKKKGLFAFRDGKYSDYIASFPELASLEFSGIEYNKTEKELLIEEKTGKVVSWKNRSVSNSDGLFYRKKIIDYVIKPAELPDFFYFKRDGKTLLLNFPNRNLTSVTTDYEKNIWLLGENNLFRLISTAFSGFSPNGRIISNIWTIVEDKNDHLWLGSLYGELQEYDGEKLILRNEYKKLFMEGACFYKGSRKMSNGDIYFALNCGVLIWDGKEFSKLQGIPLEAQVCYIYEDPDDKSVLIGTGIGLYHIINGEIRFFPEFNDNNLGVIEGVAKEDEGVYWLSGHRGLVLLKNGKPEKVDDEILPKTFTYTMELDSLEGLWITSEEGLFYRDNSGHVSTGLPPKLNMPANSIIKMNSSRLLIGRTNDICIVDLKKFYGGNPEYYRFYNSSNGFSGYDCLDNGIIRDSKGRYLILTSDAIDLFDPAGLVINPFPPRTYITEIELQDKVAGWKLISKPSLFYHKEEEIRLSHDQNNIRFSFTGISTTNPEAVQYQHRLAGYEDSWSEKSNVRHVSYEKLPPGTYTFEVMAYNADGLISIESSPAIINIYPAFWQTLAFRITAVISFISITILVIWLILRYYHKKKIEQHKIQMELSQLHLGSAIKQFDPHFTFNVLSSVGSLIMSGEKEMAYGYLLKLSGLLRSVLNDGNAIIRPISEELDFITKYCEVQKLRLGERIRWNINVDKNVDLSRVIPKLTIQIFVENAIKHGFEHRMEGGMVAIDVRKNEQGIEITVADDGVGRRAASKQKSGTGNGIKIITGIFDHLNRNNKVKATIDIKDLFAGGKPTGTEVKVFIPENYNFGYENSFN
jgi:ligand-binding sensor domain-containing protein